MAYTEHSAEFEAETIARLRVVLPMMPRNCDLKDHLKERRSISEVLSKRRTLIEAIAPAASPTNVIAFPRSATAEYKNEHRLAG